MSTSLLLQDAVAETIILRGKVAACIARLQSNLLSKALQTWIGQHATEVISLVARQQMLYSIYHRPILILTRDRLA